MEYKGYLIDLDGTMYRGETRIEGAREFVNFLRGFQIPYLFVTNNSSATREGACAKLNKMGINASPEQIITSAVAAASYITKQKTQPTVYAVGEKGLHEALINKGCSISEKDADYVVVGIDREISYEKIATASLLIQQGAVFISTNKDPAIPNERGLLPGNGALTAAIATASGKAPLYIGKPEPIIMQEALEKLQLKADEVLMVGDNYLTDIMAGIRMNIDTLMVLTGYSSPEDISHEQESPTYIATNLMEWLKKKEVFT